MTAGEGPAVVGVLAIETPELGDRSYVVHDGKVGVVIDPQRDIDRVLEVVDRLDVEVTHVLETHLYNDYVTGGFALAADSGAEYVVPSAEQVSFDRMPVAHGDELATGRLSVVAHHTPGHTPGHMAYVVREGDAPVAVFTGGSMLFGTVGRTDLIGAERTEELTRAQYRSVRCLARALPDHVAVYPTHGFGSFCSATETSGDASTVGEERRRNVALSTEDENAFVDRLVAGLTAYPRYYAHMARRNASGPSAPDLALPAFARAHLAGTVSIELGDAFATYFGWTLPWQVPVTVVGETAGQLRDARRQLVRIGIDELAVAVLGPFGSLRPGAVGRYPVTTFETLGRWLGRTGVVALDVRRADEWAAGHLVGAVQVPFWELADRLGELPEGELWVHCAKGFRAAIGASILARSGRPCRLVDDDWEHAVELGLPIESAR
jgi:hydroxyacylglutathione hydrolase